MSSIVKVYNVIGTVRENSSSLSLLLESSFPLALMTSNSLLWSLRYGLISLFVTCHFHYLCLSPCPGSSFAVTVYCGLFCANVHKYLDDWGALPEHHISCNPRNWRDLRDVEEGVPSYVLKWKKPYRGERARRQDTKSSGTDERKGCPRPVSVMLVSYLPERQGSLLERIRVWMIKIGMPSAHIFV